MPYFTREPMHRHVLRPADHGMSAGGYDEHIPFLWIEVIYRALDRRDWNELDGIEIRPSNAFQSFVDVFHRLRFGVSGRFHLPSVLSLHPHRLFDCRGMITQNMCIRALRMKNYGSEFHSKRPTHQTSQKAPSMSSMASSKTRSVFGELAARIEKKQKPSSLSNHEGFAIYLVEMGGIEPPLFPRSATQLNSVFINVIELYSPYLTSRQFAQIENKTPKVYADPENSP
jgi:hypothetical protein